MLGNNPKRKPINGDGHYLYVQEIFSTIQGEGPRVGSPSVFIRLGGCNLACSFCDTEFEDFSSQSIDSIIDQVLELSLNNNKKRSRELIVITGGEPFRQPIELLCEKLIKLEFKVQIETNGTLFRPIHSNIEIVCSPKVVKGKYLKIRPDLISRITAFKFLVSSDIEGYKDVVDLGQKEYDIPVYVQAMDQYNIELNKKNIDLAIDLSLNNGYLLSYQLHKQLGIQ
jgi:organic radical activating enzyme